MASRATESTTTATTTDEWVDVEMKDASGNDETRNNRERIDAEENTNEKPDDITSTQKETGSTKDASMSELDLVFIVDNTGSMGQWIRSAQQNVQKIVRDIHTSGNVASVRFALVSYRDHPPQDQSFVTQTHDFTTNVADMQCWVDAMRANGGGDFPEAVAAALYDASQLSYRPNSTKVAVLIADAPPHGLGVMGDCFPNGCPLGHDPIRIARLMAEMGVTIYTVICGNFEGQAFYQGVAQITGGQYIPISSAHLLAPVIVGGAQEEISLERLMRDAQETVRAQEEAAGRRLDDDELTLKLQETFKAKKAGTLETRFGGQDLPDFEGAAKCYSKASTLADVRQTTSKAHLSLGTYGGGIDTAHAMRCSTFEAATLPAAPSMKQCGRMVYKARARAARARAGSKKSNPSTM